MAYERTNLNIRPDQKEWADENNINLSGLVRDKIDEEMGE